MNSCPDPSAILPPDLLDCVLNRLLDFASRPALDLEGLTALYAAWCARVPFDNVRKMISLRSGGGAPLPGHTAREFFQNWLSDGGSGTCWPSSNALYALVRALGFDARRVAGCMRDLGILNHASLKVAIDGRDWLVDSALLCNIPLLLDADVFIAPDPVFQVEVEPTDGTHVIWVDLPPNSNYLPCRLTVDPADAAMYANNYESSRARSPFNQRLYARRNRGRELLVMTGNTRVSKTPEGSAYAELSRDEVCHSLRAEFGMSEFLIECWCRCGGLDASFEPPSDPEPPPVTRKPPSQR